MTIDVRVLRRIMDGWHGSYHHVGERRINEWRMRDLAGNWHYEPMTDDEHDAYDAALTAAGVT